MLRGDADVSPLLTHLFVHLRREEGDWGPAVFNPNNSILSEPVSGLGLQALVSQAICHDDQ